jgi:sulfatase maturation enzyme AslB (radical SAM superfamily)
MNLKCVNADHGFCTKPIGHVMPCCISNDRILNDSGKVAILNRDNAKDIWNSQYLKDLRNDLQNGIQHPNCKQCWSEEAVGYKSKRLRDNERWVDLINEPTGELPKLLDLSLGNTCNLACRTCGTFASSRWYKEIQRAPGMLSTVKDENRQLNDQIQECYADDSSIWEFLDNALPQVLHIDLYGGEPLLVKRHWTMLKSIPLDQAKNISLHFNTNGTQWDDGYAKVLCRFKEVRADISIDGVGDAFEYMRWPAKWDQVNANIQNFKNLSLDNSHIMVSICITLSILNIWSWPETIAYTRELGIHCYLNLLHSPKPMNLKTLSPKASAMVLERLESITHEQIDSVRDFIKASEYRPAKTNELFKLVNDHDVLRGQQFRRLNPELYRAMIDV